MRTGDYVRGVSLGDCHVCGLSVSAIYDVEDTECLFPTGVIHAAPVCQRYRDLAVEDFVHEMAHSRGVAAKLPAASLPSDEGTFH